MYTFWSRAVGGTSAGRESSTANERWTTAADGSTANGRGTTAADGSEDDCGMTADGSTTNADRQGNENERPFLMCWSVAFLAEERGGR